MKKRNTLIDEIRQINSNEKVVLTFGKKIESKFPKKKKRIPKLGYTVETEFFSPTFLTKISCNH